MPLYVPLTSPNMAPDEYFFTTGAEPYEWAATQYEIYLASLPYSDDAKRALRAIFPAIYLDYGRWNQSWDPSRFVDYLLSLDQEALLWAASPREAIVESLRNALTADELQVVRENPDLFNLAARALGYQVRGPWTREQAIRVLSNIQPERAYQEYVAPQGYWFDEEGRQRIKQAYDLAYTDWKQNPTRSFYDYIRSKDLRDLMWETGPAGAGPKVRWLT
jgi:hypothetical protein